MMKKLLLLICICSFNSWGACKVNVKIKIHKPESTGNGIKRNPPYVPEISMDNHTLFVSDYISEYVLQLKSGDDIVYEQPIPAGTLEIQLPEDIVGDYELIFVFDTYSFSGEITL